jgi:hypothetical protein
MNKYFLFLTLFFSVLGSQSTNAKYPYLNKLDEDSLLRCTCNAEYRWLFPSQKKKACDSLERHLQNAAITGSTFLQPDLVEIILAEQDLKTKDNEKAKHGQLTMKLLQEYKEKKFNNR